MTDYDLSPPPSAPDLTFSSESSTIPLEDTHPVLNPPLPEPLAGEPEPPTAPSPAAADVSNQVSNPLEERPQSPIHPIPRLLEARQTHMFAGSSGAGKTTWIGWFMGELLNRGTVLGHPVNRPPFCAYIAGDRTIYDALSKLERAGWPDPPYYSLVNDRSPEAHAHINALQQGKANSQAFFNYVLKSLADRYFPGSPRIPEDSLLVVDGMAPFFGIEPAGSYMRAVAAPFIKLNQFCDSWRVTILLIHHASKQKTDAKYQRSQDRALGSVAVQGFTSTQIAITEPELTDTPDSGTTVIEIRPHSAPYEAHDFRRDENGLFAYCGPHWDIPKQPDAPVASPAVVKILPRIPEDWVALQAIRELFPEVAKTTFFRYVELLLDHSLIEREVRGREIWVRRPPHMRDS